MPITVLTIPVKSPSKRSFSELCYLFYMGYHFSPCGTVGNFVFAGHLWLPESQHKSRWDLSTAGPDQFASCV